MQTTAPGWRRWGAMVLVAVLMGACGETPAPPELQPVKPIQSAATPAVKGGGRLLVRRKKDSSSVDASREALQQKYHVVIRNHALNTLGVDVVLVPADVDAADVLARMKQDPGLDWADAPMAIQLPRQIKAPVALPARKQTTTVDPYRDLQSGLAKVEAEAAWKLNPGHDGIVIAIVDTGVDANHPDLKDKLLPGTSTVPSQPSGKDDNGHGTFCAGVAAAMTDNGIGISGMAPGVKLQSVKVLDAKGMGFDDQAAEGILWAAEQGATVINLSWGLEKASPVLKDAIAYAQGKRRCTVVASMGNDGTDTKPYPAAYEGVIAVGASDDQDQLAEFSNYGKGMTVVAPGVGIIGTFPTYAVSLNSGLRDYARLDGTDAATAFVSGLVALVKSQRIRQTPAEVKTLLAKTCQDLGAKGVDDRFGAGRINARKAMIEAQIEPSPSPTPSAYW